VNGLNEALKIVVLDEPGAGNACHKYAIEYPAAEDAAGFRDAEDQAWKNACVISFQDGPIAEAGINGISNEALVAVVIDRLQGFQSGDYKCRENAIALTKLEEAMHWLQHRTRERVSRGVEGTSTK